MPRCHRELDSAKGGRVMACVVKRRGKWVLDFRDHEGKRRWETYETRKQADDALARRIGEVKGGVYRAPADLPTFEEVAKDWLAGKRDRAPSTCTYLSGVVERHLIPAFGPRRIDTITPGAVEQFRNERRDGGNKRRERGMQAGTVNQLLQNLTSVFSYAVKHGYIARNPAAHTVVERVRRARIADQVAQAVDPRSVLTAEQAYRVIQAADEGLHRTYITTAILTGCRGGELLALTWKHVDLEGRKLRISRALSWDRTGEKAKAVFGPPKTDSSYRTLDVVAELVAVLREWKMRSPFKADEDLVFPNGFGGPLHLSHMAKGLRRALDACPGLPRVSPHELRHTFASLMLLMNKPVTQVAKLLGHKDPSITLTVYSHWFEGVSSEAAMADLAAAVFSTGSTAVATATT